MSKLKSLKTISGGLYHSLVTNNAKEFDGRDWDLFCSHFNIPPNTIHSIEFTGTGFILTTKDLYFRYVHNNFDTEKRIVEIKG
jgi:hypothetical protein